MADYNVNMKQWNGTSFDNVLPLAYKALNAGKLDGKTYSEILATANQYADNYKFVIGAYVGNGSRGDYPNYIYHKTYNKITVGFKPSILIISNGYIDGPSTGAYAFYVGGSSCGDIYYTQYDEKYYSLRYTSDGFEAGNGYDSTNPVMKLNIVGQTYSYIAIP